VPQKPGYKTSEFWLSAVVILLLAGLLFAAIRFHDSALAMIAVAGKVVIAVGYGVYRNLTKIFASVVHRLLVAVMPRLGEPMSAATQSIANYLNLQSDAGFVASSIERTDATARALLGNALAAVAIYGIYKAASAFKSNPTFGPIAQSIAAIFVPQAAPAPAPAA
jgi:xanthosine utilization system XapX-like protein